MNRLSRRTLLAAAGSSVTLPWLEALAQSLPGASVGPPLRLIVFYTPNGFLPERWRPIGTPGSTGYELGPTMAPLQVHRDKLVIIDGLENRAAIRGLGPAADRSMGTLLTGADLATGATTGFPSGGAISLDQQIGLLSADKMILPPLVLGIGTAGVRATLATPSYTASRVPVMPVTDLVGIASKLFPSDMAPAVTTEQGLRRGLQQAGLDASLKNTAFLGQRMGAQDRRRLEAYSDAMRALKERVNQSATQCRPVADPASVAPDPAQLQEVGRAAIDLVVSAFSCDRARVATLVWEGANGNATFPGVRGGHNDLARAAVAGNANTALITIESRLMSALAYLLDTLAACADGPSTTLLDNTLVLACSDVASMNPVSWQGMPCLLAGRAGGRLQTGRYLAAGNAPWNQLLVSILQIFGHRFPDRPRFGNPAYGEGPLPGLT
jgi:hypothetical protein